MGGSSINRFLGQIYLRPPFDQIPTVMSIKLTFLHVNGMTLIMIPIPKLSPRIALGLEIIEPEAEVVDIEIICSGSVYEQLFLPMICLSKHLSKH